MTFCNYHLKKMLAYLSVVSQLKRDPPVFKKNIHQQNLRTYYVKFLICEVD